MGGALIAAIAGQAMLFWALERSNLVALEGAHLGHAGRAPFGIYILLFLGLLVVNFSGYFALTQWARYLRAHPDARQLPVWFLFTLAVVAGAALLTGIANHSAYVQSLQPVPMDVSQGFIAYQIATGTPVLAAVVLLGARWSPGYRPTLEN
ncbi:MAG: hypothetical protein WDZ57_01730 [Demequina sp.]